MEIKESLVFMRLLGGAFGTVLFVGAFFKYRRHAIGRGGFLMSFCVGLALAIVSAEPDSVNFIAELFAMDDRLFGRLIALIVLSNLLLWLVATSLKNREAVSRGHFDLLARKIVLDEFQRRHSRIESFNPVTVVIPAYNESENIGAVLRQIPETVCGKMTSVLVIDDGSEDDTLERALDEGAFAIASPINRGGGAALRIGFDIAMRYGAEIVVTMDADGQHVPTEMEDLVRPIVEGSQEFVIGSRLLGNREKDSLVRFVGLFVFNSVIRLLTPIKVTDCSSGFRAIRSEVLRKLELRQDQFHTAEFIIDASKKSIRLGDVPITIRRRAGGESKKGRNLSYGFNFAKTILKTWWR